MIILREHNGSEVIDFCDFESWEAFDDIVGILNQYFKIKITERIDGPESRIWHLTLDGNTFSLHNNPYGNYLRPTDLRSDFFMTERMPLFYKAFS